MMPVMGILIVLGMLIVGVTFLIGAAKLAHVTFGSRTVSTMLGVFTACLVAGVASLMFLSASKVEYTFEDQVDGPQDHHSGNLLVTSSPESFDASTAKHGIPVEEEIENRIANREPTEGPPPNWMQDKPELKDGVYRVPIHSGEYTDHEMCETALLAKAKAELRSYLEQHFGERVDPAIVPDQFVEGQLIQQRYVQYDRGQYEHHALLVFDRGIQHKIEDFRRAQVIDERLWIAGGGTAGVLLLLGLFWLALVLLPEGKAGEAIAQDSPAETIA